MLQGAGHMKSLECTRDTLSCCVTLAILAGCGGSPPPIGARGAMTQAFSNATPAMRRTSWMLPGAKSGDLLYASLSRDNELDVFSYPQGKLMGTLMGVEGPSGLCTDSAGDVWITIVHGGYGGGMLEYAHGGTSPMALLKDPRYPRGCAVDPTTGNLAVTNNAFSGPGDVAIYKHARGKPTLYSAPNMYNYDFCGYDNKGNLFVDGLGELAELPKGSTTFTSITVDKGAPGGQVQWDGKFITFATYSLRAIYRIKVSGKTGTVVGVTHLRGVGTQNISSSWIQATIALAPIGEKSDGIGFWEYPAGGRSHALLHLGKHADIFGVAVSLAPSHQIER
jgi:hypothetical protein